MNIVVDFMLCSGDKMLSQFVGLRLSSLLVQRLDG